jgi:hypothetical protein
MADYIDLAAVRAEDLAASQDCDHFLAEATIVVLEPAVASPIIRF